MKQPELPGEMQTIYNILEAPLDAKICCRNMDELLARCICKACKQCERMRSGTAWSWIHPPLESCPRVGFFQHNPQPQGALCLQMPSSQCYLCCSQALNPPSGPFYSSIDLTLSHSSKISVLIPHSSWVTKGKSERTATQFLEQGRLRDHKHTQTME